MDLSSLLGFLVWSLCPLWEMHLLIFNCRICDKTSEFVIGMAFLGAYCYFYYWCLYFGSIRSVGLVCFFELMVFRFPFNLSLHIFPHAIVFLVKLPSLGAISLLDSWLIFPCIFSSHVLLLALRIICKFSSVLTWIG